MQATTLDHVFPVALAAGLQLSRPGVRRALGQGLSCVPACAECNTIGGAMPFNSIKAKRNFIQTKLRKRLAADLQLPDWEPDELEEMGHAMRLFCQKGTRARLRATMRCNWPHFRP
jgi:hypothetical protein